MTEPQPLTSSLPAFDPEPEPRSELRQAITMAKLRPETECLPPLVEAARLDPELAERVRVRAFNLVQTLRNKPKGRGVEGLITVVHVPETRPHLPT